jgi:nucleotide-binding universal stress UspA family protein
VARRLLEQLEEGSYDLVAMTTHGRGGVQRAVLGSVATRLVTDAPRPVLVLRPSAWN